MPGASKFALEHNPVEEEDLFLPSNLPKSLHNEPWFTRMAQIEKDLRMGQAEDSLSSLRLALKYRDSLRNGRKKLAPGNKNSTRAATVLQRATYFVESKAEAYRRAREAMLELGMPEDDKRYPPLLAAQVFVKRTSGPKELGEGSFTGSWIWEKGPRGILSDDEEDEWEEEGEVHTIFIRDTNSEPKS